MGIEILARGLGQDLDAILISVGGGGLIAGLATYHRLLGLQGGNTKHGSGKKVLSILSGGNIDVNLLSLIITTNAIASLNSVIGKAIKKRKLFPTDNAAKKVIYLAPHAAPKKPTMPIRNWITIEPSNNRWHEFHTKNIATAIYEYCLQGAINSRTTITTRG